LDKQEGPLSSGKFQPFDRTMTGLLKLHVESIAAK